jgi:peroxiredoxin
MNKIAIVLLFIFSFSFAALAQNAAVTLTGQVICCEDCWVEKKKGEIPYGDAEDLLKSQSCFAKGDEPLLAVGIGKESKLYKIVSGKTKTSAEEWKQNVGRKISAVGTVKKVKKEEVFYVDSFEVLEKSLAERDASKVLGSEVELKLKDLFGAEQTLAQFKGRIVVLNFWATYCEPCRREMPDLSAIQNEFAAFGVQVVGASADELAEKQKVLQFIREVKINFPVWIGATAADTLRFGVGTALPATIIIDRDGKIVKAISGVVNQTGLRTELEKIIKQAEKDAEKQSRSDAKQTPTEASSVPS